MTIRCQSGRKTVATPVGQDTSPAVTTKSAPALKALARAFRYQRKLDDGRCASINEMAEVEWIERGYLGDLLRLTLLASGLVEAILDGRQPEGAIYRMARTELEIAV